MKSQAAQASISSILREISRLSFSNLPILNRTPALYVNWHADSEVANWPVSLGPDQPFAPPPPTWREHLRSLGHPLGTDDEIERACRKYDFPVDDLDTRLNGFGWEDRWDNFAGPQAKAHRLLKGLDLGHSGSALRQAGQIIFQEFGVSRQPLHLG